MKITIRQVINEVAAALPRSAYNDLPAIRTALNDTIVAAVKAGRMTEAQANNWSQSRAVDKVRKELLWKDF